MAEWYSMRVTQHGAGLTFGQITYEIHAESEAEAEAIAHQRAKRDRIVVSSVRRISLGEQVARG